MHMLTLFFLQNAYQSLAPICQSLILTLSHSWQVETTDRGGSFLGVVVTKGTKPVNLGLALLSNGLARLHPSFEPSRISGAKDLMAAEARARDKRLKVSSLPQIWIVCLGSLLHSHSLEQCHK